MSFTTEEGLVMGELLDIRSRHKPEKHIHYAKIYGAWFDGLRQKVRTLLEIGVGNGNCLRMWREYFPNANIYGIDVDAGRCFEEERITVFHCDQADAYLLTELLVPHAPFDIIIDDGSHRTDDQIASFEVLFPLLSPGGLYTIEDTCCGYWQRFGGTRYHNIVQYAGELAHGINYSYWKDTEDATELGIEFRRHGKSYDFLDVAPTWLDRNVTSVHFYEALCIVERKR